MTDLQILAAVFLLLAAVPGVIYLRNRTAYRRLPPAPATASTVAHADLPKITGESSRPALSVLIPARNEEAALGRLLPQILGQSWEDFEVLVGNDHSSDGTAAVVDAFAAQDPRVRRFDAADLPAGWNGKQHACHQLAAQANGTLLVFLDADLQLEPDFLERIAALPDRHPEFALWSGFPRQEAHTLGEALLVPMIPWILLSLLPLEAMRRYRYPSLGAGCGQLMVARRDAYRASGGHAAIKASRHDGLKLPRAFRAAGLLTDVFDASDVARVHNWQGLAECWAGLAKNATEGLARLPLLPAVTLLFLGGQVLPLPLLLAAWAAGDGIAAGLASMAVLISLLPRWEMACRFAPPRWAAFLHPLAVSLLLLLQWTALLQAALGWNIRWQGRRS